MRDFTKTAEPSSATELPDLRTRQPVRRAASLGSVRHTDLHLWLEMEEGSWAVPKGPTLDPKARRLAVHVEDHLLDYFDFEGVIPMASTGGRRHRVGLGYLEPRPRRARTIRCRR